MKPSVTTSVHAASNILSKTCTRVMPAKWQHKNFQCSSPLFPQPQKHQLEPLSMNKNTFTRAKASRRGITVPECSTEIRKDSVKRVGKVDSCSPHHASPSPGNPEQKETLFPWEKESEISGWPHLGPSAPGLGNSLQALQTHGSWHMWPVCPEVFTLSTALTIYRIIK